MGVQGLGCMYVARGRDMSNCDQRADSGTSILLMAPVSHTLLACLYLLVAPLPHTLSGCDHGLTANLIQWLEKALASFCPLSCSSVINEKC